MKILRNIPHIHKFVSCLRYLNDYRDAIEAAKASGDIETEKENIRLATSTWGKGLSKTIKMDYQVEGYENIPEKGPVVFMANHQGYFDVIVMCAVLDKFQMGFVAKDNLEKVPLYGPWIDRIHSVLINRGNPREGLKAISRGVDNIKQGYSMIIFPEGTRSKSSEMGEFKPGAMKLATKPKVPIIPISLDGTYKGFEEKGYVRPCNVKIKIHKPIITEGLTRPEEKELNDKVYNIIYNGLQEIRQDK